MRYGRFARPNINVWFSQLHYFAFYVQLWAGFRGLDGLHRWSRWRRKPYAILLPLKYIC